MATSTQQKQELFKAIWAIAENGIIVDHAKIFKIKELCQNRKK